MGAPQPIHEDPQDNKSLIEGRQEDQKKLLQLDARLVTQQHVFGMMCFVISTIPDNLYPLNSEGGISPGGGTQHYKTRGFGKPTP